MLKSMTGFGKATVELENKKVSIEIKSLNSKQLDIYTRIPNIYKEKDLLLRNILKTKLERGKVELSLHIETVGSNKETKINLPIVKEYYSQLYNLSKELDLDIQSENILQTIIKMPDSMKVEQQELDEAEWDKILEAVMSAVEDLLGFRDQEGQVLENDILSHIKNIDDLHNQVSQYEERRIQTVRNRISDNLKDLVEKQHIDSNRFEQEIIYYLERLDITEEHIRLTNHCKYFMEVANTEKPIGKKLAFVSQEIGREINTIGSKANDIDIQKLVIGMKDELEKVKEQLLNVL